LPPAACARGPARRCSRRKPRRLNGLG
jgi:hypothetical protein